ncbi:MAG: hypothetical protein KFH98_13345 [Gemmatimonadetes bacterium]|nr:hypothetical protein [Gemmatimonadota bacterium]
MAQLDDVIRGLRSLGDDGIWGDGENLRRLQDQVVDNLKQYEFGLRRDVLGAARERLFLSGTDEVPEGFRKLVEEYYRSLSRERR